MPRLSAPRRVAVTGVGLVSPLGIGNTENWDALLAGKSGVGPITRFDASRFSSRIAGEVKGFDRVPLHREERNQEDGHLHPLRDGGGAFRDGGLGTAGDRREPGAHRRRRRARASAACRSSRRRSASTSRAANNPSVISPFFITALIVNEAAGNISIKYGLKGPNLSTVTACTTGAHAVGEAYRMIQYGEADAAIAGGTESVITPLAVGGFAVMQALSTRNDEPQRASRPWDRDRDGFVIGEGAGLVVLEEMEAAKKRGAADLRGARRLRHVGRRVPHRGAVGGRRRPGARHAEHARGRRHRAGRGRLHQRARNLDAARRQGRDAGDQDRSSATTRKSSPSRRRSR